MTRELWKFYNNRKKIHIIEDTLYIIEEKIKLKKFIMYFFFFLKKKIIRCVVEIDKIVVFSNKKQWKLSQNNKLTIIGP